MSVSVGVCRFGCVGVGLGVSVRGCRCGCVGVRVIGPAATPPAITGSPHPPLYGLPSHTIVMVLFLWSPLKIHSTCFLCRDEHRHHTLRVTASVRCFQYCFSYVLPAHSFDLSFPYSVLILPSSHSDSFAITHSLIPSSSLSAGQRVARRAATPRHPTAP